MRGSFGGHPSGGDSATASASAAAAAATPPTSDYKLIDLGTAIGIADEEEGGDQSMMTITDMEAGTYTNTTLTVTALMLATHARRR